MRTIPLPFVEANDHLGGNDYRQSAQWKDSSNKEVKVIAGLAAAKPDNIHNEMQSGVGVSFTPLKIVLYTDGLDNSQTSDRRTCGPCPSGMYVIFPVGQND